MILNHCRLIPALSGGIGTNDGYVEIENGKIKAIGAAPAPTGPDTFDCGGKTLLPGLIDLHTHISMFGDADMNEDPMRLLIYACGQATKYLDYGYTTIRDCGSVRRVSNYVRDMIRKGLIEGPDVISCGNILYGSIFANAGAAAKYAAYADGKDGYLRAVRQEASFGADFIKIYTSGSAFSPSGIPHNTIVTREEIRQAVETAETNGLYVSAHAHSDEAVRDCMELGVRTIEHATYISEATVDELMKRENCYLVPTLAAMYVSQTDPAERAFWLARLMPMLEFTSKSITRAYRAGAKLGFGTDSTVGRPQYEKGVEFQMRKEHCGMENVDILLQATKNNAEIAGIADQTGQILTGLAADLILVDGDPDRDLSVMYQKPMLVWKRGRLARDNRGA